MANPMLQPEEHAAENRQHGSSEQFTRAFDVVELPSQGKLYKAGPLAEKTHVEVYYLTAKEEDILTAPNILRSGKLLDYLLKSVLVDKSIDPADMLLGDRNTILVWLRSTGYGSDYPVQLQCAHCNEQFENTFDLSALDIRTLDIESSDGLFEVNLPVSKKIARVGFLTAALDAELDAQIEQRAKKLGGGGNPMTAKLNAYVREVVGLDETQKRQFISTLPVADSRAIRKFIAEHEPSVILEQDAKCTRCGAVNEEVNIPITSRFLWPDSRG